GRPAARAAGGKGGRGGGGAGGPGRTPRWPAAGAGPGSPGAGNPAPVSATRSGTFRSFSTQGTATAPAPALAADGVSQASSPPMTPRPIARQDIASSRTVQVPPRPWLVPPVPTIPSSPQAAPARTA